MKKFLAVCAMFVCALGVQAQSKIGHIDRAGLMKILPERAAAEAKMQEVAKQKEAQITAMQKEYQAAVDTAQIKGPKMTKTEQDMLVRDIQEMEQRIQNAADKAKEDLANLEQELMAPMIERTDKAIKEVAQEGQFNYILDSSIGFVLYYDAGIDVMSSVKKKLNIP
jgi:outer membrane protein